MPAVAVLLTGVGYIGSALLPLLLERGARVVGLESFYCTPRRPVLRLAEQYPTFTLVEGDVASPADVARAFGLAAADGSPLVVFHLAAQPSAAIAAHDPATTERANLAGARVVLQAARDSGAARVVFGGSFRVYGDDLAGQVVAEDAPYGRVGDLSHLSKVYVEQLGRMLGVPFVSVRLGVTYGLAPVMKEEAGFMTVPNLFCQRAINGESLRVLEDRAMAFVHVRDAARALLAASNLPLTPVEPWLAANAAPEVLGIGQVAREVARQAEARGLGVHVEGAEPRPPSTFTVRSRLADAGFAPRHTLPGALGEVLDFFASQAQRAA
jgi:nucleoside-diphosphate-sugar epimerase